MSVRVYMYMSWLKIWVLWGPSREISVLSRSWHFTLCSERECCSHSWPQRGSVESWWRSEVGLKPPELLTHSSNMSDLSTLMIERWRCVQGLSLYYQTQDERSCSWRKGSAHEKNDSQNVLILNLSTKFDSAVSWVLSSTSTKCEIDQMNRDQVIDEHTDRQRFRALLYNKSANSSKGGFNK